MGLLAEALLCRCHIACTERATQEDGLCDACRVAAKTNHGVGHGHIGDVGAEPGSRMRPIPGVMAFPGPDVIL